MDASSASESSDTSPVFKAWTIRPKTCTAHMATLRVEMDTSARSWVIAAKNRSLNLSQFVEAQKHAVAYPRSAGHVLRLLPFRLRRVHQAVVGSQIHFSAPHGTLLARLRRTCPASLHDHRLRQPVTLPEAAATGARERGEPLAATTRDPSRPPPSPVCTARHTFADPLPLVGSETGNG
jgi:hypothetical protein